MQVREGLKLKKKGNQGKGIVNGFLTGTEVKGAERKSSRESQVIKLPI